MLEQSDYFDETQAITRLYLDFLPGVFAGNPVFGFIGPGDGNEIFAMDTACGVRGVPFRAVQVDRPEVAHRLLPKFVTKLADYTAQTQEILEFLNLQSVTVVVARNVMTLPEYINPLLEMADFAGNRSATLLVTVRDGEFSEPLHRGLLGRGADYYTRPDNLFLPEKHIYVLSGDDMPLAD